jgi:hypothetical protein
MTVARHFGRKNLARMFGPIDPDNPAERIDALQLRMNLDRLPAKK